MTVADLGKSCVELVQDAGTLQGNPSDSYAQKDLCDHARMITEKVGRCLCCWTCRYIHCLCGHINLGVWFCPCCSGFGEKASLCKLTHIFCLWY
jgi:hypothetical protein